MQEEELAASVRVRDHSIVQHVIVRVLKRVLEEGGRRMGRGGGGREEDGEGRRMGRGGGGEGGEREVGRIVVNLGVC